MTNTVSLRKALDENVHLKKEIEELSDDIFASLIEYDTLWAEWNKDKQAKKSLESEVARITQENKRLHSEYDSLWTELDWAKRQIQLYQEKIQSLESKLEQLSDENDELRNF